MYVVCSDLEGVFVPEIWINVAKVTGIEELRLTTRDISDYNILMKKRLQILDKNNLTIHEIQNVIASMKPFPGAKEFIDWIKSYSRFIIVSDTFEEFADPLISQLGRPTLFCHNLSIDISGKITNYILRQDHAKRRVVEAMQGLNFKVIAIGDSYNDIEMLRKAEYGILFNPPQNIADENKDLPLSLSFDSLREKILSIIESGD